MPGQTTSIDNFTDNRTLKDCYLLLKAFCSTFRNGIKSYRLKKHILTSREVELARDPKTSPFQFLTQICVGLNQEISLGSLDVDISRMWREASDINTNEDGSKLFLYLDIKSRHGEYPGARSRRFSCNHKSIPQVWLEPS